MHVKDEVYLACISFYFIKMGNWSAFQFVAPLSYHYALRITHYFHSVS